MQAIFRVQDFFHAMKKLPISMSESAAPASVLLRKALSDAAEVLLLHGAEPKRIDGALEAFGFKRGHWSTATKSVLKSDISPVNSLRRKL